MTQDECLASPHHATYEGVCYPGSQFSLTLSDPSHPQPVNFHSVQEPATGGLFALALVLGVFSLRIRARGGTKLS